MRRFAVGILAGFTVLLIIGVATWAALGWLLPWLHDRPPSVQSGSTLVLRISGRVSEAEPARIPWLEDPPPWTCWRLAQTIQRAAADPRIAAMLLMPHGAQAGWAQLAEIRAALGSFRQSGKPLVAYLRSPSTRDYYLASTADRIAGPPSDLLNIKGFRAEMLYARGALDKLGIQPEFAAMGRYKDGADIFTQSAMRPETREVISTLLDARYNDFSSAVAAGRNRATSQVKQWIDNGPFLSREAQQQGLTDIVEFEEQTREALARRLGQKELRTIAAVDYQKVPPPKGRHRIALLTAEGDITSDSRLNALTNVLDPKEFVAAVKQLRDDTSIRAVILRINSPGGDAVAAEEMTHQVRLLAEKKPVIASMSDVAASAGYHIATPAHVIVADARTVTGSIGVFFGKFAFAGLYAKLGIHKEMITRGRYAAIDSETTPLSKDERAKLHATITAFYTDFVNTVAAARRRTPREIEAVAQGRVWLGDEAQRNHLVDELGGLALAIQLAREKAAIPVGDTVAIDVRPKRAGLMDAVRQRLSMLQAATVSEPIQTQVWKRLPFDVDIH
ncbi:MAG: signal peptide peptidase SppA [Acidobacteria bacterium]|nr:signal peptide peptidase SppA [Acidobacteriota bacterium]